MIAFILIGLFFNVTNAQAKERPCQIVRVVDGDTVEIQNNIAIDELKLFIRIDGIDTPEKKGKCKSEITLAEQASEFTKAALKDAQLKGLMITCEFKKWDKYGGRILGEIRINNEKLSEKLLEAGFARKYRGEKKTTWCK